MINEDIRESIKNLVSKVGNRENELVLNDLFMSIARMSQDQLNTGDWKLFSRAVKEFRNSFRVFCKYRDTPKVCVFGSARTCPTKPDYQMAELFSQQVAEAGFMVITGAGGGIMEAGNKGAGKNSFGLSIKLPFESPNHHIEADPKLISYRYFFIRKLMFIKESSATVLFPGGMGTLDEGYEGLTLLQTGKSNPRPVILMDAPGSQYWERWIDFLKGPMLTDGYISPDDLSLFEHCHSAEEGVAAIQLFYRYYHSIRYVRDKTVLRFNKPLSDWHVDALNDQFSDIVKSGKIESVEPFPEEKMTKDALKKFRLSFAFNKANFGRLSELIRWVNQQSL